MPSIIDDCILLLIAVENDKINLQNAFLHSRYRKRFLRQLSKMERTRRQRRIPRSALLPPHESPWKRVLQSQNDQALITLTGLDFATFNVVAQPFQFFFDNYTPFTKEGSIVLLKKKTTGRPRFISAEDGLGLVLAWTRTRGSTMVLELIFGMTQTPVSEYLYFCMIILIRVLQAMDDAKIKPPCMEKIIEYQGAVTQRHPLLQNVWCTMDGIKLLLECAGDDEEQNQYYNGWTCDHYVSAVFVFCPDGTIPICCYNVPGTVHDSKIALIGKIYEKLNTVYSETGGCCTVDSAFAKNDYPFLIKSKNPTVDMTPNEIMIAREATSMRQSAEWGMRAFQASFPRVKDRIPFENKGQRKLMVKMMLLLYNLRARRVGINQILNVYMSSLTQDVNEIYNNV